MGLTRRLRCAIRRTYERITLSRYATLWFLLVFAHWAIQVSLQAATYADNVSAKDLVTSCLDGAHVPTGITVVMNNTMQRCDGIPNLSTTTCQIIATSQTANINQHSNSAEDSMFNFILPNGTQASLSSQCIDSLAGVEVVIREARIEDIVTLCFQFWLFSISLLAILVDSIPHLSVSAAGHILNTAWAGLRIRSITHQAKYNNYVVQGACNGFDILDTWLDIKTRYAISIIVCNVISLVLTMYLSWKLFRSFAKQTFTRVGPSPATNRAYKLLLCFEASLKLVAFFAFASILMWIYVVFDDPMDGLWKPNGLYRAASVIIAVIIPLLVLTGGMSIRREIKWLFPCFVVLQLLALALWATTFAGAFYQYELRTWPFFASTSITSFVFLVFTAAFGIVCRMNFGKGLAHFLRVQAALDSADFTPAFFVNDCASGVVVGSHFGFVDHRKSLAKFDDDMEHGSCRQIPFERSSTRGATFCQEDLNNTDAAWMYRVSPMGESELGIPVEHPLPDAPFFLPWRKRQFTPSTLTQSTTCSAGIVTYASHFPLVTSTARTIDVRTLCAAHPSSDDMTSEA